MSHEEIYQRLREHLSFLRMQAAAEQLAVALDEAGKQKHSYTVFLEQLLAAQVEAVKERTRRGLLRFAHFPVERRIDEFDFEAQPRLDRRTIEELATLRFVDEGANVLFIGPPGVGKTHLALGIAHLAVQAGRRTYYTRAADLVARCHKGAMEGRWATTMRFYAGASLLVIDELGYLPLPAEASSAIFQVISRRAEIGSSTIITTNRGITSWGEIFDDQMVAAAILDRFLHRATVVQIDGDSYRMRAHRERAQMLRKGVAATHSG